MAAAGIAYLVLGFDIVMTERGSAMTIGGTIALCAGILTIALGGAVLRLTQILRVLEGIGQAAIAPSPPVASRAAEAPASGVGAAAGAAAGAAVLGAAIAVSAGAPESVNGSAVQPDQQELDLAGAPCASAALDDLSDDPIKGVVEELLAEAPVMEPTADETGPAPAPAEPIAEEPSAPAEFQEPPAPAEFIASIQGMSEDPDVTDAAVVLETASAEVGDADPQPLADDVLAPAGPSVLGSYRAGGRTYTMYSDGSVEAATVHGVEKFESMQALREHLAKT